MSVVYLSVAASGTSHAAVSATPTAPIATARPVLFRGREHSQITNAPTSANTPTTR